MSEEDNVRLRIIKSNRVIKTGYKPTRVDLCMCCDAESFYYCLKYGNCYMT